MSLLTSATAVEDSYFDVVKTVEDTVLHIARTLAEGFEPLIKQLPERPSSGLLPAPGEMAHHTFDFVDRLVSNLREFTSELVALTPREAESRPTPAKTSAKAHAA
jgi:hypothetical protein